jgi:hypothetical protein
MGVYRSSEAGRTIARYLFGDDAFLCTFNFQAFLYVCRQPRFSAGNIQLPFISGNKIYSWCHQSVATKIIRTAVYQWPHELFIRPAVYQWPHELFVLASISGHMNSLITHPPNVR